MKFFLEAWDQVHEFNFRPRDHKFRNPPADPLILIDIDCPLNLL